MWFSRKKYAHEAFISHAFQDKAGIADELCARLKAKGLNVWYSGDQLVSGSDLHEMIKDAVDQSRFGVVIFSKNFIGQTWTERELNWLQAKETGKVKVILPIRHELSIEELAVYDPHMASKVCFDAARGLDYVIEKILDEIKRERTREKSERRRHALGVSLVLSVLLLIVGVSSFKILNDHPTAADVQVAIESRVDTFLTTLESRYINPIRLSGLAITKQEVDSVRLSYNNFASYYRNEYEFNCGTSTIRGRKNVEERLHRNLVLMADQPQYGLDSVDLFWANRSIDDGFRHTGFSLINKRPVVFAWDGEKDGSKYTVHVDYLHELRFINVSFTLPPQVTGTKRHEMTLLGFPPSEVFYFDKGSDGEWHLTKVE